MSALTAGFRSALLFVAFSASFAPAAFAAGTISDYRLLMLNGAVVKWGEPALGTGAVVTYAIVDRPREFPGTRNCAGLSPIDELLSDSGLAKTGFQVELQAAFAAWSAVADVRFIEAAESDANIIIGAQTVPVGRAFTNVAPAAQKPGDGRISTIASSLICLNPRQRWKVGFDGDLDVYDLRYTLLHEIGHAIGLDHPPSRSAVMDFRYVEAFATLQSGDGAGAASLYGAPKNENVISANAIGSSLRAAEYGEARALASNR